MIGTEITPQAAMLPLEDGTVYIYGLYCPITGSLHYIGKSASLLTRYLSHYNVPPDCIATWIKSLRLQGKAPQMRVLDKCNQDTQDSNALERAWIGGCYAMGDPILNIVGTPRHCAMFVMATERPAQFQEDLLDDRLNIRVNSFELVAWKAAAKAAKMSFSNWLRRVLNDRTEGTELPKPKRKAKR